MERAAKGEPNVLTPQKPIMMSMSSGTTGTAKMFPVTEKAMEDRLYQVTTVYSMYIAAAFVKRTFYFIFC